MTTMMARLWNILTLPLRGVCFGIELLIWAGVFVFFVLVVLTIADVAMGG